jgi:hypothetical protein
MGAACSTARSIPAKGRGVQGLGMLPSACHPADRVPVNASIACRPPGAGSAVHRAKAVVSTAPWCTLITTSAGQASSRKSAWGSLDHDRFHDVDEGLLHVLPFRVSLSTGPPG